MSDPLSQALPAHIASKPSYKVPRFEDGKILSEKELYALAHLSMDFFSWSCIVERSFGFFAPSSLDACASAWNQIDLESDSLIINNLHVISPQGHPFILSGKRKLDKVGKTLFAVAYLAKDSSSYAGDGYRVDFRWDLPNVESNPYSDPFILELGEVAGSRDHYRFEILPKILWLNGTSNLWLEASQAKENIDRYIELLIYASGEDSLDCSEYLARLESLNTFSQNTEVDKFIDAAVLTLKSAVGFYRRLIYCQSGSQYESCKNLHGRALERKLEEIDGDRIEPEVFEPLSELLQMDIGSGQAQEDFVRKLRWLFDSTSRLVSKLKGNRQEIPCVEGYPRSFDVRRQLYCYKLRNSAEHGQCIVVEFNVEPANVALIFTQQKDINSTTTLVPLRQESKRLKASGYRYRLLLKTDSYLFIAAPAKTIKKVEIISEEDSKS